MSGQQKKFDLLAEDFRDLLLKPPATGAGDHLKRLMNRNGQQALLMRKTLNRSHCYVLSDDFTEAAAKFSDSEPEMLNQAANFCRMPFDTIWLEWNDTVRRAHSSDGTNFSAAVRNALPKRRGLMIDSVYEEVDLHRIHLQPVFGARTAADPRTQDQLQQCNMGLFAYELSLGRNGPMEGAAVVASVHAGEHRQQTKAILDSMGDHRVLTDQEREANQEIWKRECWPAAFGFEYADAYWDTEKEPVLKSLLFRTQMLGSRIYPSPLHAMFDRDEQDRTEDMAIPSGDARFALAVLSLLTDNAGTTLRFTKGGGGKSFRAGKFVPKYEYKVIELTRPVSERIIELRQAVIDDGYAAGMRQHDVEGHWCHSHRTGSNTCLHAGWDRVLDGDGRIKGLDMWRCTDCEKIRWWRKPHKRGNPEIGVLDKGYEVVTESVAA